MNAPPPGAEATPEAPKRAKKKQKKAKAPVALVPGYGVVRPGGSGFRPRYVIQVDSSWLSPVLARPPLGEYLRQLWERRHFIVADARARAGSEHSQTLLGKLWLVIEPLMNGAVFFFVFGMLLSTGRGIPNFIGYLLIGMFLFQFTTNAITRGSRSLIAGRQLVRSFSFPRAALPIASVARNAFTFVPALATLVVLILLIPLVMPHLQPEHADQFVYHVTWRWFLVPGVLALQLLMTLGLVLLTARAVARIPDLAQLISIFTRFWLYISAVFFSIDRFANQPTVQTVMEVNPMYQVLHMARDCLIYGVTPAWTSWALLGAWSGGLAVLGFVVFWHGEQTYGRA